ncbi:MAG: DUF2298 domain-containing protein [Promethearchaeota archaeon]
MPLEVVIILALTAFSVLLFPLVSYVFQNSSMPEKVFISSILSFALLSYLSWLIAIWFSLHEGVILLVVGILGALNLYPYLQHPINKKNWKQELLAKKDEVLISVLLFFIAFILILLPRVFNPAIGLAGDTWWHGAVVGQIITTRSIPPPNPWYSGSQVTYPYFFHLFTAILCILFQEEVGVVFNVEIPFFAGITALGGYSLAYRFTKSEKIGLLSTLFLFCGNLSGVYVLIYVLQGNPIPQSHHVYTLTQIYLWDHWHRTGTFAASFVSYFFSTEPITYSWPFFIFTIYLLILSIQHEKNWFITALLGFMMGYILLTYPFEYLTLLGTVLLFILTSVIAWRKKALNHTFKLLLSIGLSGIVYLPYLLLNYGKIRGFNWWIYAKLPRLGLWVYLAYFGIFLFLGTIGAYLSLRSRDHHSRAQSILLLSMIAFSLFFANIWYLHTWPNTYNQIMVQTWIPFSVFSGIGFKRVFQYTRPHFRDITVKEFIVSKNSILGICLVIILAMTTLHTLTPFFHITRHVAAPFEGEKNGLDALVEFKRDHPEEYEALMWIRENIPGDPIFLEKYAEAYKWYPRVATVAQKRVVLGWSSHMRQYLYFVEERAADIDLIYNTSDLEQCLELLRVYDVEYVYIGSIEKEAYSANGLAKFSKTPFEKMYENKVVQILKVPIN